MLNENSVQLKIINAIIGNIPSATFMLWDHVWKYRGMGGRGIDEWGRCREENIVPKLCRAIRLRNFCGFFFAGKVLKFFLFPNVAVKYRLHLHFNIWRFFSPLNYVVIVPKSRQLTKQLSLYPSTTPSPTLPMQSAEVCLRMLNAKMKRKVDYMMEVHAIVFSKLPQVTRTWPLQYVTSYSWQQLRYSSNKHA